MATTTTLQDIQKVDASDFACTDAEYERLLKAQYLKETVTVDCEACDGYYDITLSDGTEVPALSAYHLVGFTADRL